VESSLWVGEERAKPTLETLFRAYGFLAGRGEGGSKEDKGFVKAKRRGNSTDGGSHIYGP